MRRSFFLPSVLALGLIVGCDMNNLAGPNKESTVNTVNSNEYFPINEAQWEFSLSVNGASVGTANAFLSVADTTGKLKVFYTINGVEKTHNESYQWNNGQLVATQTDNQTYPALKSSMKVGDSWAAGSDTIRVASIGDLNVMGNTVKDVVRVDRVWNGQIGSSIWYAKGIGIVQVETKEDGLADKLLFTLTKHSTTVPSVAASAYFPMLDGSLAEFKVYLNGQESGKAMAAIEKVGETGYLKVLTRIGGQEEGMKQSYQWNGTDLVATDIDGQANPRSYTALKSSLKLGDAWTVGTESIRVASIGDLATDLGTLNNVLRVDHSSGGKVFNSMWYAKDYGLVQVGFEPKGTSDWLMMKIAKYSAQPAPITLTADDLFPLASVTLTMEVFNGNTSAGTTTATLANQSASSAEMTIQEPNAPTEVYEHNADNNLQVTSDRDNGTPQLLLKFPLKVGKEWTVGQNGEDTMVVAGYGPVQVPYGNVENAVRVVRLHQGKATDAYWFASGLGFVQVESWMNGASTPRVYKLSSRTPTPSPSPSAN